VKDVDNKGGGEVFMHLPIYFFALFVDIKLL
jgi:hypothetical protein